MTIARLTVERRAERSVLVRATDSSGRVGVGEASPLPGYSPDEAGACARALAALDPATLPALSSDGRALASELGALASALPNALPAAQHALQTAALDLEAQRRGEPIWALLRRAGPVCGPVPSLLPVAALLDQTSDESALASADRALGRGVRTLKLKLGRRGFDDELALLERLRARVGAAIQIRLDVNRLWSAEDAPARLAGVTGVRPELVEECMPAAALARFESSPVPLAVDESLQDPSFVEQLPESVRALVLKPMALGGYARCLELASWAHARGLDVIVSHLFDGPVALAAAAHLALAVGSSQRAAGLAEHSGLDPWPRVRIPLVREAHLLCDDAPGLGLGA